MKERNTWEKRMVGNQDEWEENQGIPLCASVPGGRLPGVKFSQGALRNPLEHLLGEDSQQLPADVQGFIHCPVVVRAWGRQLMVTIQSERAVRCAHRLYTSSKQCSGDHKSVLNTYLAASAQLQVRPVCTVSTKHQSQLPWIIVVTKLWQQWRHIFRNILEKNLNNIWLQITITHTATIPTSLPHHYEDTFLYGVYVVQWQTTKSESSHSHIAKNRTPEHVHGFSVVSYLLEMHRQRAPVVCQISQITAHECIQLQLILDLFVTILHWSIKWFFFLSGNACPVFVSQDHVSFHISCLVWLTNKSHTHLILKTTGDSCSVNQQTPRMPATQL